MSRGFNSAILALLVLASFASRANPPDAGPDPLQWASKAAARAGWKGATVIGHDERVAVFVVTKFVHSTIGLAYAGKDGGAARAILLDPSIDLDGRTSATITSFFGRSDLLDVDVSTGTSTPVGSRHQSTHYLVRSQKTGYELVCGYQGSTSFGMEEMNGGTELHVELVRQSPLELKLTYTSSGRVRARGEPGGDASPYYLMVPDTGTCRPPDRHPSDGGHAGEAGDSR